METLHTWHELDAAFTDPTWAHHAEHTRSTLVFRGLARADYTNISSLSRLQGDYATLERHLLRNFRKYAHQQAPGPTTWDWLALGQHHGLPTRLLDWTFSPLVALHFATASWPDHDAVLFGVDCAAVHRHLPCTLRDDLAKEGSLVFTTEQLAEHAPEIERLAALEEDGEPFLLFFEPPTFDERIASQAAVLSVISDARCQVETWLGEHPDCWRAWRIPTDLKAEVRERLDQAQITERALMPGLDGLAAYLRRYYSPKPSGDIAGSAMDGSDHRPQQEGSMTG
ncbi:MAG TPA: FRG domain-containing protein [Baekduia sp.]|nr:FRG domain-containing protein [Baekduia sp.]